MLQNKRCRNFFFFYSCYFFLFLFFTRICFFSLPESVSLSLPVFVCWCVSAHLLTDRCARVHTCTGSHSTSVSLPKATHVLFAHSIHILHSDNVTKVIIIQKFTSTSDPQNKQSLTQFPTSLNCCREIH